MGRKMGNPNELKVVNFRLIKEPSLYGSEKIESPEDAVRVIADELKTYPKECFSVLCLKTNGQPICFNIASLGTIDSAIASPRDVILTALLAHASSILILHNHPGADHAELRPSQEDRDVTSRLMQACSIMGLNFLDHIIVSAGSGKTYSFRSEGELERLRPQRNAWER